MGTWQGGFLLHRAGLLLIDVLVGYDVLAWLRPVLVAGYAMALNPDNALGYRSLGVELDLGLELRMADALLFQVYGGVLLPGRGLAATVNTQDLAATDPIYSALSALKVSF